MGVQGSLIETEESPCKVVTSPGGRWILAPNEKEKARFLKTSPGEAVFTAQEIDGLRGQMAGLSKDERQDVLADIVAVKRLFEDAVAEEIRWKRKK